MVSKELALLTYDRPTIGTVVALIVVELIQNRSSIEIEFDIGSADNTFTVNLNDVKLSGCSGKYALNIVFAITSCFPRKYIYKVDWVLLYRHHLLEACRCLMERLFEYVTV